MRRKQFTRDQMEIHDELKNEKLTILYLVKEQLKIKIYKKRPLTV